MARTKGDGEKQPSQMAMVRTALQEMPGDPKPQELQEHIKTKFGREIPTIIISNYKSQLKRKGLSATPGRRGRKPGGGNGSLRVEDFETVRGLVGRLGAEQVRRLVNVIA
jgi:hypothetical protein